ncbi:hypothetical protein [Jannaschia sp. Os4]|uniref:hypothetical protein n=1 Tax=Jannaschia sp. Os4 TaxID=2807617 RepID=UPI0031B63D12
MGQGGGAVPEPEVGLLQSDDMGAEAAEDPEDAGGVAPPIEADGLADVVGGDPEQPGGPRPVLRPVLRRRVIAGTVAAFVLLAAVAAGLRRDELAAVAALAAALSAAPVALASRLRIVLPLPFVLAFAAFLALSLVAGEAFDAYERVWWWDLALHGASATGLGLAGFLFVLMLFEGDRYAAPPWALAAIAACLAVTAGTAWELFEYAMDHGFGLSMQKSGLPDTMGDLAVNLAGAALGAAAGWGYLRGRGRHPATWLIVQFVRLNARRFRRR